MNNGPDFSAEVAHKQRGWILYLENRIERGGMSGALWLFGIGTALTILTFLFMNLYFAAGLASMFEYDSFTNGERIEIASFAAQTSLGSDLANPTASAVVETPNQVMQATDDDESEDAQKRRKLAQLVMELEQRLKSQVPLTVVDGTFDEATAAKNDEPAAAHSEKSSRRERWTGFCVTWSPPESRAKADLHPFDRDFCYVLEVSAASHDGSDLVEARYFGVIRGERQGAAGRDAFVVVERKHYAPIFLKPVAAYCSANTLGRRFPLQMKQDFARHPVLKGQLLSDKLEKEVTERYIEQAVLRRLGSCNDNAPGLRIYREFAGIEERLEWARRINGSDSLGWIQWLTFLAFWILVLEVACRLSAVMRQEESLADSMIFPTEGGVPTAREVDERLSYLVTEQSARRELNHSDYESIPLEIAYAGISGLKAAHLKYEHVPSFVDSRADALNDKLSSSQWLVRFLLWLIPSVGFVGTVIGIGASLQGTGDVLSPSVIEQQSAIQVIANKLGTAFDTTFVALVLVIVAMFLANYLSRRGEWLVRMSADRTVRSLIDPTGVPAVDARGRARRYYVAMAAENLRPVRHRFSLSLFVVLLLALATPLVLALIRDGEFWRALTSSFRSAFR